MPDDVLLQHSESTEIKQDTIDPKYTRVTSILYPFSGLEKIDKDVIFRAGLRGTRVHNECESIVRGLGRWDLDPEIDPYVESFLKWWDNQNIISIEERFYCDKLLITGKTDMIIRTDEGDVIFDLKTSYQPSKTWALQGSAYAYMARQKGYNIKKIQF